MQSIQTILTILLAVLVSGYLVRVLPFSAPLPLVQIALGALIAGVLDEGVVLNPEIFFLIFVPPLLYLDGWRIPKDDLRRDRGIVLELAFGLVFFTVLGAGLLLHWMIPAMPLAAAFALAAIVSPTDPVAVSSLAARVPVPRRLMHVLEGESLLNDASGLVCFRFAVAAVMTGSFSLATASLTFVWLALAGLSIGVLFTLAVNRAQAWLSEHVGQEAGTTVLISLLTPFGAYMLAEYVHASGILAAVAAGITMSQVERAGTVLAKTRVQRAAVWDTVQFSFNGIMFVLLGEQLPRIWSNAQHWIEHDIQRNAWWLPVYALALYAMLTALRFVWVWVSWSMTLWTARRRGDQQAPVGLFPHWQLVLTTTLAGARGAITLAGVMSLPLLLDDGQPFPMRDLIIFLATSVILVSLLVASVGLPRVLRGVQLPAETKDDREQQFALRKAAQAAIKAVDQAAASLPHSAEQRQVYSQAAARVTSTYESRRLNDVVDEEDGAAANALREADAAERELRVAALRAERETLFELSRTRQISDALARRLVRDIDLAESHQRQS